jgi:hypothetical protein
MGVPININASASVVVAPTAIGINRQFVVTTGGLTIAGASNSWTGKLDLNNNDMDIPGGNLATLTNQIFQGFNNGRWNGSGGIVSTSAANNTTHLTALGIILNSTDGVTPLYGTGKALGTFDNTSPAATDVLIKYTYYGDSNLDGKVDGTDYSRIDNGALMHLTSWYNGDFNYDGVINGSDYTLIDNAFNTQGAQIAAALSAAAEIRSRDVRESAVPEPTCMPLLLGTGIFATLRRRRSYLRS